MSDIKETLADYVKSRNVVVFKGRMQGGGLAPIREQVVTPDTPCTADFASVYDTNIDQEIFITLIKDPSHGPLSYFYEIENLENGKWIRQLGAAYIISKNEIGINKGDGVISRLILSKFKHKCGKEKRRLILYKYRTSTNPDNKFLPNVAVAPNLQISSVAERNATIKCDKCDLHD